MRFHLFLTALALALPAHAGIAAVWAASDGDKIEKDDLNSPLKRTNAVWDGKRVRLFAARNEIVAFQIIVEADSSGIAALRASLPELSRSRSRIASHPAIQLFSVNYMLVEKPTNASWIYRQGTPSAPQDPTGWKPVQLVPHSSPVQVQPNNGQSLWIEIYTGRDRPPGLYRGEVTLSAGQETRRLPVELEVLNFALPDENSMHAMVYFEPVQTELYHGRNLEAEYHRFAHRHRIELVHAYDEESVDRAFRRFDGTDFTRRRGYEGPGEGVGNRIVPRTFYGPGPFVQRQRAWLLADRWIQFLAGSLPNAITFIYLPDEPRRASYDEVRRLGEMIHANPGPGRKLRTFLTHTYTDALEGAADIWCSGPRGFQIDRVRKERERGRSWWIYNGGRPAGGAVVIDAPATDARSLIWAAFKHDIDVYFYWHSVHWRHNNQKPRDRIQNVWANPVTYDNGRAFANGDGVLIYPGQDVLHPDQDRGFAGPIGTIQLANFRRGLQDHQYLTLARNCGAENLVQEALTAIVPRVFSDAGETVGFSESAAEYEAARSKLGRAIAACGPQSSESKRK